MKQIVRRLKSTISGHCYYIYYNPKNRQAKGQPNKMSLKKYDPIKRIHAIYKEASKLK